MRGRWPSRFLPVLALLACLCLHPAQAEDAARGPDARFKEALLASRDPRQYSNTVAACQDVIGDPKSPAKLKERAFDMLIAVHARKGARAEAIEAAEALRLAFPKNAAIDRRAVFQQADQYELWTTHTNVAPAVAVLSGFLGRRPSEREACAQAWLRLARFQSHAGQFEAGAQAARKALATDPDNASLGVEALWLLQDNASRARKPEERLDALMQSLDPRYRDALSESDLTARREGVAATLRELKRGDALQRFLADLEQRDTSPTRRQHWCFLQAEAFREQAQPEAARAAYERVFTDHPACSANWPEAQARIVDTLADQGRLTEALQAARVLWDAAHDPGAADRAAQRMAELLRLIDKTPKRADAWLLMHRYGPAGHDGKPGTADDPAPVLDSIGYPDLAARRQAFAEAAPAMGDGADASLQRGTCALYAGEPRAALAHFADALRRCQAATAVEVTRQVLNGFRALHGHGAGLDDISHFIAHGPAGPDGLPGTDDDLADPFAPLGLSAAAGQPGGLVPLSTAEAESLCALAREFRELVARSENQARRLAAVAAYGRVCEALVVLDRAETRAWILNTLRAETDDRVLAALVRLGQTVAKSNQLDLSGLSAFDADATQLFEQAQRPVPAGVAAAIRQAEHDLLVLKKKPRTPAK